MIFFSKIFSMLENSWLFLTRIFRISPLFSRSFLASLSLVRTPLWTTMNSLSSPEVWGCEFNSEGTPCVAHRVCAIPEWDSWIPKCRKYQIMNSVNLQYGWMTRRRYDRLVVWWSNEYLDRLGIIRWDSGLLTCP